MSVAHEVPPPVQMVQLLAGFQLSQALYTAAVLGVADLMTAGPVPAGVLSRAGRGARAVAAAPAPHAGRAGVFTEPEPGVFALTPLGSTLTRSQPGSMRDLAIMWMETHYAPFGELAAHRPQRRARGRLPVRPAVLLLACPASPGRSPGSPVPWPT